MTFYKVAVDNCAVVCVSVSERASSAAFLHLCRPVLQVQAYLQRDMVMDWDPNPYEQI